MANGSERGQIPADDQFADCVLRHLDGVDSAEHSKVLIEALAEGKECRSRFVSIIVQCQRLVEKLSKDKLAKEILRGEIESLPEALAEELQNPSKQDVVEGLITPYSSRQFDSSSPLEGVSSLHNHLQRETTRRRIERYFVDRWKLWGGIAACFLVVGLTYSMLPTTAVPSSKPFWPPERVARIEGLKEASWESEEYSSGQALNESSELHLLSGHVQISMLSGAELILYGPCKVVLDTRDRIRLKSGRLSADVADWAHGFTVDTSRLEIVDLGTTFSVEESVAETDVFVLEGAVAAVSTHSAEKKIVRAGYGASIGTGRGLRVYQGESTATYSSLVDSRPFRLVRTCNTGQGIKIGRRDPCWTVSLGPRGTSRFDEVQPAVAVKPRTTSRYLINDAGVSQWIGPRNYWGTEPDSVYTFATTFRLDEIDPSTATLVAHLLGDNRIEEIRLNGTVFETGYPQVDDFHQQFLDFHTVEINNGFVEGENLLEIDVFNGRERRQALPNPMLFRTEWIVYGRFAY